MPYKTIPISLKQKILNEIKENGKSVTEMAEEHDVTSRTIYTWLSQKGKGNTVSWRDFQKLKKENETLKAIVGSLTLDISRTKKI